MHCGGGFRIYSLPDDGKQKDITCFECVLPGNITPELQGHGTGKGIYQAGSPGGCDFKTTGA